jgi:hypothetical protein
MNAFSAGAGYSMEWIHYMLIGVSGVLFILSAIVCFISFVLQMEDPQYKFNFTIVMKTLAVVFITTIVIGLIGTM